MQNKTNKRGGYKNNPRIDLPISKIDRAAERQRTLKEILINIRNGAMISPAIFAIEQLYRPNN